MRIAEEFCVDPVQGRRMYYSHHEGAPSPPHQANMEVAQEVDEVLLCLLPLAPEDMVAALDD
jgi:hypothetical protein